MDEETKRLGGREKRKKKLERKKKEREKTRKKERRMREREYEKMRIMTRGVEKTEEEIMRKKESERFCPSFEKTLFLSLSSLSHFLCLSLFSSLSLFLTEKRRVKEGGKDSDMFSWLEGKDFSLE